MIVIPDGNHITLKAYAAEAYYGNPDRYVVLDEVRKEMMEKLMADTVFKYTSVEQSPYGSGQHVALDVYMFSYSELLDLFRKMEKEITTRYPNHGY